MTEKILAWHSLNNDGKLRFGREEVVVVGKRYEAEGELRMCYNGMHASVEPLDALYYAPGSLVCRVELSGEILRDTDKLCARYRKVLAMADATRTLHLFACDVAEEALSIAKATDERSHNAIRVKRAWLDGKATTVELGAARSAAVDATTAPAFAAAGDAAIDIAWAAARAADTGSAVTAAWSTAISVARAAAIDKVCGARDAARATTRSAAIDKAWVTAMAVARSAQNQRLTAMLDELLA